MLTKLEEAYAEQCRRSFFKFFCHFWETIEAGELILSWHIEFLCNFLQGVGERWERKEIQDDVLINLPFGLSKSTIVQLWADWMIERNPAIKILGISYSKLISGKNSAKVKEGLLSDKYQKYFPNRFKLNPEVKGKTLFGNLAKGVYYTSSTGGGTTGMHSDIIINDDPVSAGEANSKVKRDRAKTFISGTLSSRKTTAYTVTITIMQRLHMDDPSSYLLAKKPLQHVCLPAFVDASNRHLVQPQSALIEYDKHDGYLSPQRFNEAKIKAYKLDLTPYEFAAQVQQNPLDDSTGIFRKDDFEIITWEQFQIITRSKKVVWEYDFDTALTDKRKNDPTAMLASYTVDDTTYIRESYADWLSYEDLLDYVSVFVNRNGKDSNSTLWVEPKANGKSVIDSLNKRGGLFVKEAPAPLADKVQRAHAVLAYVYKRNVKLIDGSWIAQFLQELTTFPNALHDDRVDTLTQCLARVLGIGNKPLPVQRIY